MLEEQITNAYKEAMKKGDSLRASTLSFLRAQFKNVLIDKKLKTLEDAEVINVINKQVKQRLDSIEQFDKGGRNDLVQKEKLELEILKSFLPQELSDAELKNIIENTIKEAHATSMKDMGNVMKAIIPQVAGKANNQRVSQIVKDSLSRL